MRGIQSNQQMGSETPIDESEQSILYFKQFNAYRNCHVLREKLSLTKNGRSGYLSKFPIFSSLMKNRPNKTTTNRHKSAKGSLEPLGLKTLAEERLSNSDERNEYMSGKHSYFCDWLQAHYNGCFSEAMNFDNFVQRTITSSEDSSEMSSARKVKSTESIPSRPDEIKNTCIVELDRRSNNSVTLPKCTIRIKGKKILEEGTERSVLDTNSNETAGDIEEHRHVSRCSAFAEHGVKHQNDWPFIQSKQKKSYSDHIEMSSALLKEQRLRNTETLNFLAACSPTMCIIPAPNHNPFITKQSK